MKSFKDYVKIRSKPIVSEMAVAPIMRGDKEIRQKVKTPIQFDQDDIRFLQQFPPEFWAQALNRRYSILLYQTYELHKQGKRMPENIDVEVIHKGGTKIKFPVQNAKMNELCEELDGMEDADRYSKLRPEDLADEDSIKKGYYTNPDGSERTRITRSDGLEKKLSKYGYDLEGFVLKEPKKDWPFYEGHAKAYVVPGKVVCRKIIGRWTNDLQDGWYDDEVDGPKEEVFFGGGVGGRGKKNADTEKLLPVKADERGNSKVFVFTGTTVTRGGKKGSIVGTKTFTTYMPDIKPGFHVDGSTKTMHDEYLEISKELSSTKKLDDYINLLSENFKNNPGFDVDNVLDEKEVEKIVNSLKDKSKNKKEIKKLLEFVAYLRDEKNKKEFINRYETFSKLAGSQEAAIRSTIQKTLEDVVQYVEKKRIDVISNATRYNAHQWNAFRHGGQKSPHTLVGVGGHWSVLGQQVGVYYERLRKTFNNDDEKVNEFWNHLANDLGLLGTCRGGAKKAIEQHEDLKRIIRPGDVEDVEVIYIKSLKEAMIENLEIIGKNALEQFLNKAGLNVTVGYAKKFKKQVVDQGVSIEDFIKKSNRVKLSLINAAFKESGNYVNQVWQLQKRFLERKYDRDQSRRPENPYEHLSSLSLYEIIEKFHSGELGDEIAPGRTSHDIATLESALSSRLSKIQNLVSAEIQSNDLSTIQTDQKGKRTKQSVNKDDEEKQMNQGIFRSTMKKVKEAIDSTLGSAARRISGAVSSGAGRLRQIMQRSIMGKQQDPKQEDPKQEDPKQEDPKQEDPKQEDPKQEDPKQEDPKQEDPKQRPSLIQRFLGRST